jgi:hypothetical protein
VELGGIKTIGCFILPKQGRTTVEDFKKYLDGGGW